MHIGHYIFTQIIVFLPQKQFRRIASKYDIQTANLNPSADLIRVRRQEQKSIDEEDVRHQIAVWLNRGHIKEVEMDVYEKVNFRSAEG